MSSDINNTPEQESTIFSAPTEHIDKKPKKAPKLKGLIAAFLGLVIIAGSTIAVISLIPKKEEEKDTSPTFNILNIDSANIEKMEVKNSKETVALLSTVTENEGESKIVWTVDGVNPVYTDSSIIENTVEDAAVIDADKEISGNPSDFGLDNPKATVTLYPRNEAFKTVTVKLGNSAPANLGYYCSLSTDDKIYLVNSSIADVIGINPLDFSTTTGLSGVIQTEDNAECFADGLLTDFDYITISGKNYATPLKIVPQEDETLNAYFAFKIESPSIRIGDDDIITELINLLSSGIASSGSYMYEPDADSLKLYRLDEPDVMLTISVANKSYSILASKTDENFYAAIDSNGGLIHKIPASTLTFAENKAEDYYSSFIVLENLSGLSNFKAELSDGTAYNFKTVYTEEGETYQAFIDNKELDIENFKAFYRQFISLSPVEYSEKQISEVSLTIKLVHSNGSADTTLLFKPYSSGRYQVELNNIPMGLITSTSFDKLVQNIKNVAAGTAVIE